MNDEVLKPILESDLLTEESKAAISEAFEKKLEEERQSIEVQLREEFAGRYENDKSILVAAVERMVDEGLQAEIAEFTEDRNQLAEKQVQLANEIRESRITAKKDLSEKLEVLEQFVLSTLGTELQDFANDRAQVREAKKDLAKQMREGRVAYKQQIVTTTSLLENFVLGQLKTEMVDFNKDKQALVDQRVKMISEGKEKIETTRKEFIKRASNLLETKVPAFLQDEMEQFREDIQTSREKAFGQKLFDEYAAEFKATFFNESAEVRKLQAQLTEATAKVTEAGEIVNEAQKIATESKKRQQLAESETKRTVIMTELLENLVGEKKEIMSELLEGVQTPKLRSAFKKYVSSVISSNGKTLLSEQKVSTETKKQPKTALTGDRKQTIVEATDVAKTAGDVDEFARMKKLAGI